MSDDVTNEIEYYRACEERARLFACEIRQHLDAGDAALARSGRAGLTDYGERAATVAAAHYAAVTAKLAIAGHSGMDKVMVDRQAVTWLPMSS